MIQFRQKENSDKITRGLYQVEKAKNTVHNLGVNVGRKIHNTVAGWKGNQNAIDVYNRAARIDANKHTNQMAAIRAARSRQKITPENVAKGVVNAAVTPITTAAKVIARPGPALDKVIGTVVKNPCLATGELLDDATSIAGTIVAPGNPKLAVKLGMAPFRMVGAAGEGIAKVVSPSYKKNRRAASRAYEGSKFSGGLKKFTVGRILRKFDGAVPQDYVMK